MDISKLLIFLSIAFYFASCKQSSVIGQWKRMDFEKYRKLLKNDTSVFGNLSISADSTFFINGDGRKNIDTVPGWHTGGDFTGTWSIVNKTLVVQYAPKENPFGIRFSIIRLTKRKLILASAFDKKHKHKMKYNRI